ncbi:MAG: hypothetical protein KC503_41540 [Myxococcales bacterium]|nr:hypothetical protein [Myxococcales bacterium]
MLGGARWLCVLLILVGSSAWAEGDEYKGAVDKATALLDAGKYEEAVAAYSKIMLAQRQSCTAPPAIDDVAKLARTSPCWRMLMMQFNIALTRKRQGNTQKKLDAFRTYVTNWRHAFPKLDYFPLIERATYEIAAAQFQLEKYVQALRNYRSALEGWRKRHAGGKRRAKFADDANQRIAECLEKVGARAAAANAYETFLSEYEAHHGKAHPVADVFRGRIAKLRAPAKQNGGGGGGDGKGGSDVAGAARARKMRIAGIIAGGVGVASLAVGVAFGVLASNKASDVEQASKQGGLDFEDFRDDVSQGQSFQAVQIAMMIAGGVALAAGVGLFIAGIIKRSRAERAASAPSITVLTAPTRGGAYVGGALRF